MAVAQINDILHKRIKIFSAQNSMKISEVIEKAFNEYEKNFNEKKEKEIL
jgi:ketopantoate reductase